MSASTPLGAYHDAELAYRLALNNVRVAEKQSYDCVVAAIAARAALFGLDDLASLSQLDRAIKFAPLATAYHDAVMARTAARASTSAAKSALFTAESSLNIITDTVLAELATEEDALTSGRCPVSGLCDALRSAPGAQASSRRARCAASCMQVQGLRRR